MERQDQEGPAPCALRDDGQEAWVDAAEVVVLDAARDWHAIIAALLGGGLTKHVAKLGAAVLRTPCHLRGREGEREGREERSVKEDRSSPRVLLPRLFIGANIPAFNHTQFSKLITSKHTNSIKVCVLLIVTSYIISDC